MCCGVFAGHASRECSWARRPGNACVPPALIVVGLAVPFASGTRRSQDAVPARAAPWGEIRRQPPRTEPEPRKNAVSVGVEDISTPSLHPLYQELTNSARGSGPESEQTVRPASRRLLGQAAGGSRDRGRSGRSRDRPRADPGPVEGGAIAVPGQHIPRRRIPERRATARGGSLQGAGGAPRSAWRASSISLARRRASRPLSRDQYSEKAGRFSIDPISRPQPTCEPT